MELYNDIQILNKIIDISFSFTDLSPKAFPQLRHGIGLYCPFHDNSHTGTQQARIYFNEERNMFYLYCYAEQKAYYPHDYVNLIMCKEKQLYKSAKDFLTTKLGLDDFNQLYTFYKAKKKEILESKYKKKCTYIDNVYEATGNTVDYIEALYTA